MTIYLILFGYLALGSVLELLHIKVNGRARKIFYWIIAFTLMGMAGFRYGLETDYWHYYYVFHGIVKPSALELGFMAFQAVIRFFTNDYNVFCVMVALISLGVKEYIFSKCRYSFIILFCYYLRFYVLFELNVIRQGIAMAFVILAVASFNKQNIKKYFVYLFVAVMFHSAAICALLAILVKNKNIKFKHISVIYIMCLTFRLFFFERVFGAFSAYIPFVLGSNNTFIHGTQYIINSWDKVLTLDYLSLLRIIVPGCCFYFVSQNEENKLYFNLYFIGTIINIVFWGLDTISFRIPAVLYMFEGFMLNDALCKYSIISKRKINYTMITCLVCIAFCDIWTFFSYLNESTTLIPYRMFFGK